MVFRVRTLLAVAAAFAGLAAALPAHAVMGGAPVPGPGHGATGQLLRGGAPMCGAALIGPGWAITAAHCLDEVPQAMRMLVGPTRPLPIGRAYRSPDGGDVALLEVPEAAALRLPHLAVPPPFGACPAQPREVAVLGAAHAASEMVTRVSVTAQVMIYDECDPARYTPTLISREGMPTAICAGDSGSAVTSGPPENPYAEAVVVAEIDPAPGAACGRNRFAIGFAEPLRMPARLAWLARTSSPPIRRDTFAASLIRAPEGRVRVRPAAWQASPPPGAAVSLVDRRGHVWARTHVTASGLISVAHPPAGTYRLRAPDSGGTRWSTPLRIPAA